VSHVVGLQSIKDVVAAAARKAPSARPEIIWRTLTDEHPNIGFSWGYTLRIIKAVRAANSGRHNRAPATGEKAGNQQKRSDR
jgi:hypothetical protein